MNNALNVRLAPNSAEYSEDLDERTINLLAEISNVAKVSKAPPTGRMPENAKSVDLVSLGHLLVTLTGLTSDALKIMNVIRDWLDRQPKRRLVLEYGEHRLELSNADAAREDKVILEWFETIAKSARSSSQTANE